MMRDGRWFWWIVGGCLTVVAADLSGVGPFAEADPRPRVEVLGEVVEREVSTTTTVLASDVTTTAPAQDEDLEVLEGLTPEDLEAIEELVDEPGG